MSIVTVNKFNIPFQNYISIGNSWEAYFSLKTNEMRVIFQGNFNAV